MATDYLLPCTCGRTHRISSRQAGEKLACPCGISLDVPTMRGMNDLELAAPAAATRQRSWSLAQGFMFLGLVMVGAGMTAGLWYSLVAMPTPQEAEISQAEIDKMPMAELRAYWSLFQQGINALAPPDRSRLEVLVHQQYYATNCLHLSWLVTALGGAISGLGILIRRIKSGRR
jgi:hypothetical protein